MDRLLIVFVKYPEPGRVKTRLGKELGFAKAAQIYETLVKILLDDLLTGCHDLVICADPENTISDYKQRFGSHRLYWLQEGRDLGDRMANAFRQAFNAGYSRVLLMGSDVPLMDLKGVSDFFQALDTSEMVIGPAEDGGYYLIGFQKGADFQPVFQSIPWSSNAVFRETMNAARDLKVSEGKIWFDIDTARELAIYQQLKDTGKTFSDIDFKNLTHFKK